MSTAPDFKKNIPLKSEDIRINNSEKEKDLILSHEDAEAASPEDDSVCGEEEPGVALETLVTKTECEK